MKNQKRYPFNTIEDFKIGFYLVAEHSIRYFLRYKSILEEFQKDIVAPAKQILLSSMIEMNQIIEGDFEQVLTALQNEENSELVKRASETINLGYNEFKDYEERLSYNYNILLNDFGDLSGASYLRFRKEYDKKRKNNKNMPKLDDYQILDKLLRSCQKNRNYVHHFSEPKLVAWRNYRESQLAEYPGFIWPPKDIEITRFNITNIISILKLSQAHDSYFEFFNALQFCVRNDYCLLSSGTTAKGEIRFEIKDCIEDSSAFIISELGGQLYSE